MATCNSCALAQHTGCKHVREGKTKKDRGTGAWGNRFSNRAARVSWSHQSRPTNDDFPRVTCNGKKNRHTWTGKGNTIMTNLGQARKRR